MKNIVTLKLFLIPIMLVFVSCSNSQENDPSLADINVLCTEPELLLELNESIPATVKVVEDGQPFFNGSKKYYEVDLETHIPELFERFNQKILRIFPISKINSAGGAQVQISGKIYSCITGHHGLLTNDLKGFTLISNYNKSP